LKKKACFKHYSSCCVAAETVFFPAGRRKETEKFLRNHTEGFLLVWNARAASILPDARSATGIQGRCK
jgi:hypothetical protein